MRLTALKLPLDTSRLFKVGVTGAVVSALCCLTPLLVLALAALGFSAAVAWLDYLLIPAFAGFSAMALWALIRMRRRARSCDPSMGSGA